MIPINRIGHAIIYIDKSIDVYIGILGPSRKNHYINLGYVPDEKGIVKVPPRDLSPMSAAKILIQCPACGKRRYSRKYQVAKMGHTCCQGCARLKDVSGKRFGKLTAISIIGIDVISGAIWLCKCEHCGEETEVPYSSLHRRKSCGCLAREQASQRIKERDNPNLGKFGAAHHNWNPNKTEAERLTQRNYTEYAEWRLSVFKRDRYSCCVCSSGNKINAHHLFNYSTYRKHRHNINNGITLCDNCHSSFHTWNGNTQKSCVPGDFCIWIDSLE